MTPYSALAGGRLARPLGGTSKRFEEDSYARLKYDAAAKQDAAIIERVAQLAESRGVTMTEISLGWLLARTARLWWEPPRKSMLKGRQKPLM